MSHARHVWLVAAWEFRRYFKWKDQFLGLLIFVVLGGIGWAVGQFATGDRRVSTIAVSGFALASPAEAVVRLVPAPAEIEVDLQVSD